MVLWIDRPLAYKMAFLGLLISNVCYVIAFALPFWACLHLQKYGMVDQTVGLWQACVQGSSTCISNVHGENPAWINAARATCSLCVLMLAVSVWCGYYRNCTRHGQTHGQGPARHVEYATLVGCLFGLSGIVIFSSQFHKHYVERSEAGSLYWAFYLACFALTFSLLFALVMFVFNCPDRHHRHHHRHHHRRRRCRGPTTLHLRGPRGLPVTVQFSAEMDEDRLHIPYFGEISRAQLAQGALPMQPPAYEAVSGERGMGGYSAPPRDLSEAPPLYEDIAKDSVLSPPVQPRKQEEDKSGTDDQGHGDPGPEAR